MKIEPNGIGATEKYLTISVAVHLTASIQFGTVRVPIEWLLSEHVTDAMDRTVRRRLIENWSEVDLTDPLF